MTPDCQYGKIWEMAKERRTRSQKIIASLRRQVEEKQTKTSVLEAKITNSKKKEIKHTFRYDEPVKLKTSKKTVKKKVEKEASLYNYDPSLIKKDLLKTVYLAVLFFIIVGLFYWYFEGGGNQILARLLGS